MEEDETSVAPSPRRDVPDREAYAELLRARGLPLFLGREERLKGLVPRCAPMLLMIALMWAGVALTEALAVQLTPEELDNPTVEQYSLALGATGLFLGAPLIAWVAALVLRLAPKVVRSVVAVLAIVAVLGPCLFPGLLVELDLGQRLLGVLGILVGGYLGLGSMSVWAAHRAREELSRLGSLVSRVLPVLMLTLLFSFYNAEIWQVTAQITMRRTWAVVAVITLLGLFLAVVNARDEVNRLLDEPHERRETGIDEPLRRREMVNLVVMNVLITLIQVTLLAVLVFIFYIGFGVLSVSPTTAAQWIGAEAPRMGGLWGILPVSRPLAQVSLVLAAFSALSFVASAGVDPAYRSAFVEPALAEVREGLRVRHEYLNVKPSPEQEPAPVPDETASDESAPDQSSPDQPAPEEPVPGEVAGAQPEEGRGR